jgi:serine/threonine protein kinase
MNETKPFTALTDAPPPAGEPAVLAHRYVLGALLGRGGMADVLRAQDTVLNRTVAVKLFRTEVAAADGRGHESEMQVLAALRHPGLVTLFDAGSSDPGTVDERPFLVMELVDGPSLAQQLTRGPLPQGEVTALGRGLADTLAYVHSRGVVHRDVKPANILLDPVPGRLVAYLPKLTDFGVARMLDTARLTQHGMTVGTANYLSPEQATGGEVSGASDVYALGLVLIECLTGQIAYPGSGVAAASARLHRPPRLPAHLGEPLRGLLQAMTSLDPLARPDAAGIGRLLDGGPVALSADPSSPVKTTGAPAPAPAPEAAPTVALDVIAGPRRVEAPRRRSRERAVRLLPVLAAAAVALAALLVILVPGGSTTPSTPAPPAPAYPSVGGSLGSDLHQLEHLVGQ